MTEIREATRELLNLACAVRGDWSREETWAAIYAAKTAGLPWDRLLMRLLGIALRDEDPPTSPRELRDDVRGVRDLPGTGAPLDPGVRARLLADLAATSAKGPRSPGDGERR